VGTEGGRPCLISDIGDRLMSRNMGDTRVVVVRGAMARKVTSMKLALL
jgi:hypothetical protein